MDFETPAELLARLKLGREEALQRMLTCLILRGPYPRWNSRNRPSAQGLAFLSALYERHFAGDWPGDDVIFVEELEMLPERDDERGGAPDYALFWEDRVWIIELKTERGSHRADQIPGYFRLAHHHFPKAAVDLLYLTPPMQVPFDPAAPWARYAHTTWEEAAELIADVWNYGVEPGEQAVIDGLLGAIDMLAMSSTEWRARVLGVEVATPPGPQVEMNVESEMVDAPEPERPTSKLSSAIEAALEAAELTAVDGKQRGIEYAASSYEALLDLCLLVRDALAASPPGSPLRHVEVWRWRPESLGQPLTTAGREHGVELRLSRHAKPLYD